MKRLIALPLAVMVLATFAACERQPPTGPTAVPHAAAPRSMGPVAFVSDRGGESHVYLADEDGSNVTLLTSGRSVTWAPGGRQLAVRRTDGVFVVQADGSGLRKILDDPFDLFASEAPDWSPDGSRLVLGHRFGIVVIDADGSNLTRVLGHEFACGEPCDGSPQWGVSGPVWSPDGLRIAFGRFAYDDLDSGIYVMNADGTNPEVVALEGASPAWSPDGAWLAFDGRQGVELVTADGLHRRVFHPTGPRPSRPRWTNRGAIVFAEELRRIYLADASGAARQLVPDASTPANTGYRDFNVAWVR